MSAYHSASHPRDNTETFGKFEVGRGRSYSQSRNDDEDKAAVSIPAWLRPGSEDSSHQNQRKTSSQRAFHHSRNHTPGITQLLAGEPPPSRRQAFIVHGATSFIYQINASCIAVDLMRLSLAARLRTRNNIPSFSYAIAKNTQH